MLNVENVATPATAVTCAVPLSVPLDGFVPMAIVIWLVAVVTTLPTASSTLTRTAGVIEPPATTLLGCTVKISCVAAPITLNALLVADVKFVALAVSVYPTSSARKSRPRSVAVQASRTATTPRRARSAPSVGSASRLADAGPELCRSRLGFGRRLEWDHKR